MAITAVTSTRLIVIEVVYGALPVQARLQRGEPLAAVMADVSSLQKLELGIEFAKLKSIVCTEGQTEVRLEYEDEQGRTRRKTTYIGTNVDRERLLEALQKEIGHRFRHHQQPAGFWRLAWSQIAGAVMSLLLTMAILVVWDPQALRQARGGNLVLWLGREGCLVVGGIFVATCLISAWLRVRRRPSEHHWLVWTV